MKNPLVIGLLIVAAIVIAGSLYWYKGSAGVPGLSTTEAEPTMTQTDSLEDVRKDLEGTQVVVEDSEYSSVTTDINGL